MVNVLYNQPSTSSSCLGGLERGIHSPPWPSRVCHMVPALVCTPIVSSPLVATRDGPAAPLVCGSPTLGESHGDRWSFFFVSRPAGFRGQFWPEANPAIFGGSGHTQCVLASASPLVGRGDRRSEGSYSSASLAFGECVEP